VSVRAKQQRGDAHLVLSPEGRSLEQLRRNGPRWRLTAPEDGVPAKAPPRLVPALENAIAIVEYLNRTPSHLAALAEIAAKLGISRSHCHAILKTLTYYGWLKFDSRAKTYRLHSGILASASTVWRSPALDSIRERLSRIPQAVSTTCTLSQTQADDSFVLIDKWNGPEIEISVPIGHRYPRDAAAHMRAFIAWQPREALERWIDTWLPVRYTQASIVTPRDLRAEVATTRERGYACSVGEFTIGITSLALPIFDADGEVDFIFSCVLFGSISPAEEARIATEMRQAALDIHRAIFARPPPAYLASLAASSSSDRAQAPRRRASRRG
jgi:DNA-binding IclR family transcriptional regulator